MRVLCAALFFVGVSCDWRFERPPPISPDSGIEDAAPIDATELVDSEPGLPDADVDCDPVSQLGCIGTQKCTWIRISDSAGTVGCVPNGSVAPGASCDYGADGEATGYDDCVEGSVCVGTNAAGDNGICEEICTTAPDSCPASLSVCSRHDGLFTGVTSVGACDFRCNPGNKIRKFDNALECGSSNHSDPSMGCYGYFGDSPYVCRPARSDATHGLEPTPNPTDNDTCAPGYQRFQAVEGPTATQLCIANCVPQESYMGNVSGQDGLAPNDLTTRGVLDPSFVCQFLHFWYPSGSEITAGVVNGIAFDPGGWLYDDDMNAATPEVTFPTPAQTQNCDDLSNLTCNAAWGYAPFPVAATSLAKHLPFTLVSAE